MDKHLYNRGVEKPFLSMTENLGGLIPLNQNQNQPNKNKISRAKTT